MILDVHDGKKSSHSEEIIFSASFNTPSSFVLLGAPKLNEEAIDSFFNK